MNKIEKKVAETLLGGFMVGAYPKELGAVQAYALRPKRRQLAERHAGLDVRQDLTLLGYNVYCDGERVNDALITGNTFSEIGDGDYYVTAVYDKGESALSEKAIRNHTGISELPADTEKTSRLYDLMGRPATGKQKGIYIQGGKKVIKN